MRCFIALGLDPAPGLALAPALEDLAGRFPELAVRPPENLHLTLVFLGELDDEGVGRAREATLSAAGAMERAWSVEWGDGDAFPSRGRPQVVWIGVADPAPTVRARGVLEERLVSASFRVERRPYRPHLTLARVRRVLPRDRAGELTEALARVPRPPASAALAAVLYRSRLGQGRPSVYEELFVAPLGRP